jgi:glycogen synthase
MEYETFDDQSLLPSRYQRSSNGKLMSMLHRRSTGRRSRRQVWQILSMIILALVLAQSTIVFVGYTLVYHRWEPGRVGLKTFPSVTYKHLNMSEPLTLERGTRVFHVAKEFGPASMGGLGAVLTALAKQQQRAGHVDVSVVLPFYSLLRQPPFVDNVEHYVTLDVDVLDGKGFDGDWAAARPLASPMLRNTNPERRMSKIQFDVSRMPFWIDETNTTAVNVYLIGPGHEYPFDRAFRANDILSIYSSPSGLPQEWKDLYFEKAVSRLIEYEHTKAQAARVASASSNVRPVDIVHIHGATNAMLAHYLARSTHAGAYAALGRPAVVYTLHDYFDEVTYVNNAANVDKFLDHPLEERPLLQQYRYGNEVFMSPLGISHADMATFVSRSLTEDLVEGRLDFYMKQVAMESILAKARSASFIGITNGIDLHARNPFNAPELVAKHLNFPSRGSGWPESTAPVSTRIRDRKRAAKAYLYREGLLTAEDLDRPLLLFIGRFQVNKGLEFFADTADYLARRNARFVIMGQQNSYSYDRVRSLRDRYPNHVTLIDDLEGQKRWGIYLRTAADFAFVPSLTESFGLVAAEGLLFGAAVVSTGAGGLREFLVDRPRSLPNQQTTKHTMPQKSNTAISTSTSSGPSKMHNAYLFNPTPGESIKSLTEALSDALDELEQLRKNPDAHEAFLEYIISTSVALGWDQPGGPVETYHRVYAKAIESAHLGNGDNALWWR